MLPEAPSIPGRRTVLGAGAALIGWGVAPARAAPAKPPALPKDAMAVTLLGTGSPILSTERFGMSTLVQAGGLDLVFDAGRGCTIRLDQCGLALGQVDALFVTHFHSDHLNGLPDLWMTSYLRPSWGRRSKPLVVYGPRGIGRIVATMGETFSDDVRIRLADEHVSEPGTRLATHEFVADGVVFEQDGVKVTAFEVNHGPLIKPAYGYRIDCNGSSVLLSGDTRFDENLIGHGQGLDLLVHEVAVAPLPIVNEPYMQEILNHHTTPEQAGAVFSRTNPKLAVFSHIAELSDATHPPPGDDELVQRTRINWGGSLIVGTDLTRFILTPGHVAVQRFDPAQGFVPVP